MLSWRLASMSQPESNGVTGSPPTIYVVDDEQVLLDLAEMILEPAGFAVCLFRGSAKGAGGIHRRPLAPGRPRDRLRHAGQMNGMDLIRECKRLNPQQKTILLSGTVDEGIYADSPVRPDRFLAKPYQINKLVEVIRSLLAP